MSAKPRFKPRVGWAPSNESATFAVFDAPTVVCKTRVRVTDARDLTPEKAVEKVLQTVYDDAIYPAPLFAMEEIAKKAGMTARVVNGKVRVWRAKQ